METMGAGEFVHYYLRGPFEVIVHLEQGRLANDADAIQKFSRAWNDITGKITLRHSIGRPPKRAIEALEVNEESTPYREGETDIVLVE